MALVLEITQLAEVVEEDVVEVVECRRVLIFLHDGQDISSWAVVYRSGGRGDGYLIEDFWW